MQNEGKIVVSQAKLLDRCLYVSCYLLWKIAFYGKVYDRPNVFVYDGITTFYGRLSFMEMSTTGLP